ncbi:MAG: hypothetical protein ACODAE_01310 [Gemmatimonadota bacterium]
MGRRDAGFTRMVSAVERFAGAAYFVCALLVLLPAADFLANVWPWAPGDIEWRYGAYGLLSGFLMTPTLGVLLVLLLSTTLGHRRTAKVLAAAAGLIALVILSGAAAYALDAVQIRSGMPEAGRARFDIGSVKAVTKNVLSAVALGWLGLAAWRSAASSRPRDAARRRTDDSRERVLRS